MGRGRGERGGGNANIAGQGSIAGLHPGLGADALSQHIDKGYPLSNMGNVNQADVKRALTGIDKAPRAQQIAIRDRIARDLRRGLNPFGSQASFASVAEALNRLDAMIKK